MVLCTDLMALFLGAVLEDIPQCPRCPVPVSLKPQSCLICHSNLFMLVFSLCWHVALCDIVIRVAGGCRAAV